MVVWAGEGGFEDLGHHLDDSVLQREKDEKQGTQEAGVSNVGFLTRVSLTRTHHTG